MSILVNKNTRMITQGITGKAGRFHTEQCIEYGSSLWWCDSGKRGHEILGFLCLILL